MSAPSASVFQPTVWNRTPPPGDAPERMVWIPGGEFSMGANDPPDMRSLGMRATEDARPIHRVYVDGFFMDATDVTNAQFGEFVRATGYVTVGERKPLVKDFPATPAYHACNEYPRRNYPNRHRLKARLRYLLSTEKRLAIWEGAKSGLRR